MEPHERTGRIYVIDDVGLLQKLTPDEAERAAEQGQIEPTDRRGFARLIPRPIREMTPEEKRQRELERQKAERERRGRRSRRK
jgi:hypothetical protein